MPDFLSGLGGAAGTVIGGPIGGAIGSVLGGALGSVFGGGGSTGGPEQYLLATFGTGDKNAIRQRLASCGVPLSGYPPVPGVAQEDVVVFTPLGALGITPAQAQQGCTTTPQTAGGIVPNGAIQLAGNTMVGPGQVTPAAGFLAPILLGGARVGAGILPRIGGIAGRFLRNPVGGGLVGFGLGELIFGQDSAGNPVAPVSRAQLRQMCSSVYGGSRARTASLACMRPTRCCC